VHDARSAVNTLIVGACHARCTIMSPCPWHNRGVARHVTTICILGCAQSQARTRLVLIDNDHYSLALTGLWNRSSTGEHSAGASRWLMPMSLASLSSQLL
jgi:hypothetical protein